ncbi:MAG: helix-turn-helix domain-containing protein [Flammeovirgaceae bacterium]
MDTIIIKKQLGQQLKTLRESLGVKRYDLEKKGLHPSLSLTIEEGKKGYSMDSLEKYVNAINECSEKGKISLYSEIN